MISHELQWYADSMEDPHLWVCIGHMAEAEAQIQRESAFIADRIREQRLILMKEGAAAASKLSLHTLINMVTELAESQAKPLGVEPSDANLL